MSEFSKNPYMDIVEYTEFLSRIAEKIESIKGFVGGMAIHDLNNIQGLLLNQVRIIELRSKNDN